MDSRNVSISLIEGLSHGKRVNSIYSRARGEWGERGEEGAKERERERKRKRERKMGEFGYRYGNGSSRDTRGTKGGWLSGW